VYDTLKVLTRVFLRTELSVPTTVQSTSFSCSACAFVRFVATNWLVCGDDSRSQRTAHVLFALI
jgi:hypothetical protein